MECPNCKKQLADNANNNGGASSSSYRQNNVANSNTKTITNYNYYGNIIPTSNMGLGSLISSAQYST